MTTAQALPLLHDLTPAEREAAGKAARRAVPRAAHAGWSEPARRDPLAILQAQDASRVPELVPIRWGRMLVSPFTFYRGAAALMAADLAGTQDSGLRAQVCGDAHISNFGVFAAPDRSLVFDLNDFDETLPGPWEWDVKRMAVSIEIAGRDRGEAPAARKAVVRAAVRRYREAMRAFAGQTNLAVWYARLDVRSLLARAQADRRLTKADRRAVRAAAHKADAKTSVRALTKLTEVVDGDRRFRSVPPLLVPLGDLIREAGAPRNSRSTCATSSAATTASVATDVTCSTATTWWTSPARSSAWAASGRGRG